MTTLEERAAERDLPLHGAGCNERYWRERALKAEGAIVQAVLAEREACAKKDYEECDYAASLAPDEHAIADRSVIDRIVVEKVLAATHDRSLLFRYDIGRALLSYIVTDREGWRHHYDSLDAAIAKYEGR